MVNNGCVTVVIPFVHSFIQRLLFLALCYLLPRVADLTLEFLRTSNRFSTQRDGRQY